MKSTLLHKFAAVGMGAALLFTVTSVRADDPQPKRSASTDTHATDTSTTHHKTVRTRHTPSIDGRYSTTTSAKSNTVGGATGREKEVPTGSHLPATYQRKGYTTNNDPTTFTYDHNDIRLQNSNTVSDSLRQIPGVNVGGSR